MHDGSAWARWGRYAVAAAFAGVVTWFAFIAHREVPVLDWFDLGVHETGHLVMAFAPRMAMFLAGSVAQVAVPLALAWYFGITRRDAAGGGFCLAWAGASAWDVSVYIADAPVQALPLIGGGNHDWAYLLGPRGFDAIQLSDQIAGFVEYSGAVLAGFGIVVAAWAAVKGAALEPSPASRARPSAPNVTVGVDPWIEAAKLPFKHESGPGTPPAISD